MKAKEGLGFCVYLGDLMVISDHYKNRLVVQLSYCREGLR